MTTLVLLALVLASMSPGDADSRKLPEFGQSQQSHWINSKPSTVAELAGKVILVDVWTFG